MTAVRIPPREYAARRSRLMAAMGEATAALISAAPRRRRNGDVDFPHRQDSNFHYLCGFDEPDAVLALVPGRAQGETIVFCHDREPAFERFHGERLGPDRAPEALGLDDAFPLADIDEILPGLLEGRERLYCAIGADADCDRRVMDWVSAVRPGGGHAAPPSALVDLGHLLHDMRLVKSAAELKVMREAACITTAGHLAAMRACRPGRLERDLEAELLYAFRLGGARDPAYPCIVGAGANACVLHYIDNDAPLAEGDLVLIDAGCEYHCYASDVTRTLPVSGRFSAAQRELYDVVLNAQQAAIEAVVPGNHFNQPHEAAMRALTVGLRALGVLEGDLEALIAADAGCRFAWHKTSHWLGLDVHDVGDYRIGDAWRVLEPGMVLTVEPGLYVPGSLADAAPRFAGMGIRIEDDVAVTRGGCEVLSAAVPKAPDDIEAIMGAAREDGA